MFDKYMKTIIFWLRMHTIRSRKQQRSASWPSSNEFRREKEVNILKHFNVNGKKES